MTSEEAIEILKTDSCVDCGVGSQSPCTCTFDGYCDIKDAMEMAIKALEQEPCEDAVSREQVLLALTGENLSTKSTEELIQLFNKRIKALPPVTPTRKKGYWEQYGDFWKEKFRCSECGKEQPKILRGEKIIGFWSDFCPNCGADIRGNEE